METPDTQAASVELKIGEETYNLCFTFAAMQEAKRILQRKGIRVNLLIALDSMDVDVDTLPALLFAALRTHHPEIDYKRAESLIDMRAALPIFGAICDAYIASVKSPKGAEESSADPQVESKD
jgi:hypothetical protein